MSASPLTLETLKSPTNESSLSLTSPLMSPQNLKAADSLSNTNDMDTIPERPSNLKLDSLYQQQPQQQQHQHSNVTPTSSTITLHGNISPALSSSGGSLSPSFLPEMPQWKRDLILRRKQNVQRTISASSPTSLSSVLSSSSSSSPTTAFIGGGLKTSTSSSSVRSLVGSSTHIDQLASDGLQQQQACSTKDYIKTSLLPFGYTTATTAKVNKQNITTTGTNTNANTTKPATNIKSSTTITSPLKEKAEKLFGGQYTATKLSSSSAAAAVAPAAATIKTTKEVITIYQQQQEEEEEEQKHIVLANNKEWKEKIPEQQENNKMMEENEEEHFEMYRKTKELLLNDETKQEATTTTAIVTNKQQIATRLTGSTYSITTNTTSMANAISLSPSSSSSSILKRAETEREKLLNTTQSPLPPPQQHNNNITGANVNLTNQSLNKCESERLICAASNKIKFNTANSNTNNSVTASGGISNVNCNIISNNCSSVTATTNLNVGKISQKLQENQFIKNEQQQQQLNIKKNIKYKTNTISGGNNNILDLKSPTKISTILTTSNSTSSLSASLHSTAAAAAITSSSSSSTNCAIKKKMVAVQEMKKSTTQNSATRLHSINSNCHATNHANNRVAAGGAGDADLDNSEDLSYGPGIVSKLRCRYLSLALRESMEQQRLNKDHLRRSTSLNNLLDNAEDEENCDDEDDEEDNEEMIDEDVENQGGGGGGGGFNYKVIGKDPPTVASTNAEYKKAGILKTSINGQEKRFSHNSQGSNGVGVTFTETSYNKRSRHLKRGNDSLKRARSVEALLSEKSPWHTRANSSTPPTCVTIEDKIHNARERLHLGTDHMPPKRLTSIIDDTERPPPDLVKQTLKMFEATANRRPRTTNRSNSKGDVASKVETFKNIIKEQKPIITFPKPLSPSKKMNTPPSMQKPLKTSTPQAAAANDLLLQSPLGKKTIATAGGTSSIHTTSDCLLLTPPLKAKNTLLDHNTPDIIPRQKFNNDNRDLKQNKDSFSAKEKFFLNENEIIDSTASSGKQREHLMKETFEVDSPITALSKELKKMKLNDNTPSSAVRKGDNNTGSSSDNYEPANIVGGVGAGDNNGGDACQRHNKYSYNNDFVNEEIIQKELNINSSLQNENDKFKNKIKPISTNEATNSSQSSSVSSASSSSSSTTAIETKNEATVNNYDSVTKAASPLPSSSDLSDVEVSENYYDDDNNDEYGGLKSTKTTTTAAAKRITRTALDNIAKAGYTQQFKFNTSANNTNSSAITTSVNNSTTLPLNTGKQIGVIRPLLNTNNQQQPKSTDSNMETLKHSNTTSLTSREIEKNRINDLKKSSATSSTNVVGANSSPPLQPSATSLDHHQVIKSSYTSSSPATTAHAVATANNSATGSFSDVDTVISATNSPLWAMRKRRQAPPAQPAENTSMVFNFSNRKEVPDYIENDGVIFRRKRELPKPNESGFVLLGDLSVETSTDMDYDDFAMCPPSPCDVEFVNANIVIDGKSSIRQKSKDTAFHVQFNDTLTSTFEYPSEASLIVDESFTAYNESYAQPLDSSSSSCDDFVQAFQNLNLESATHHHIADEIIQLPTFNASSTPAAAAAATAVASNTTNSPTKNILGNLPLDYPDLQKGTQLIKPLTTTLAAAAAAATPTTTNKEDNNEEVQLQQQKLGALEQKKSRKDLKLQLSQQQVLQKPPLPIKRFQMTTNPAAAVVASVKLLNCKNLPRNLKTNEIIKQQQMKKGTAIQQKEEQQQQKRQEQQQQQHYKENTKTGNASQADLPLPRKTPRVLNNPQYACFLQQETKPPPPPPCINKPIQRSRSNEFQKSLGTLSVSATVSRSNSLRNLEYVPANRIPSTQFSSATDASTASLCYSAEVNLTQETQNLFNNEMAKDHSPNAFKNIPPPPTTTQTVSSALIESSTTPFKTALDPNFSSNEISKNSIEFTERTQALNNSNSFNLKDNNSSSGDNIKSKKFPNFNNSNDLREQTVKSLENFKSEEIKKNLFKTRENINKITQNSMNKNFKQNSQATESQEKLKQMASFDAEINDVNLRPLDSYEDATANSTNLDDFFKDQGNLIKSKQKSQNDYSNENSKENLKNKFENRLDANQTNFIENCNKNKENLAKILQSKTSENSSPPKIEKIIYPPTKSIATAISLTVNSKYVTDYKSKITKNLPYKEIKFFENLTTQKNNFKLLESQSSGGKLSEDSYEKEKSLNLNKQSKSFEHLEETKPEEKNSVKLSLKGNSISSDNFSDLIQYSLFRKTAKEDDAGCQKPQIVAANSNLLLTNQNIVMSVNDDSVRPDDFKDLKENYLRSHKDNTINSSAVITAHSLQNDKIDGLTSQAELLLNANSSELNLASSRTLAATDNDDDDALIQNFECPGFSTNNKSLQISTDSLDNCEENVKESKKKTSLTDLEAAEILEDIAIGGPTFTFDFSNLLTIKKSKTAYCLQSLETTNDNSIPSDEDDDNDNSNFVSASNTLESKCSLKPCETNKHALESFGKKQTELHSKKSKTMRNKTTERIFNLSNMATQNVSSSSYATFRKSKNFYKNASKSFKNSLRFYETFNEKSTQTKTTPHDSSSSSSSALKRSNSLMEDDGINKAELNRKLYAAKSNKIITKLKNTEKEEEEEEEEIGDSPTENSYSFEYFDAETDFNGNLNNQSYGEDKNHVKPLKTLIEINQNFNEELKNILELENKEETLKEIANLKTITNNFYLNTSPQPFKRIYESNMVKDTKRSSSSSYKSANDPGCIEQKLTQAFEKDGENLNDKPLTPSPPLCFLTSNDSESVKSLSAAQNNLNSIDFTECSAQTTKYSINTPIITNYTTNNTFSTFCPIVRDWDYLSSQRANSFSTFESKRFSNDSFERCGSFNTYLKNVSPLRETFNNEAKRNNYFEKYGNANNNNLIKSLENNYKFNKNLPQNAGHHFDNKLSGNAEMHSVNPSKAFKLSQIVNSPIAKKSNPQVETFKRNLNATEFSFNLIKFSTSSPKFIDNSPMDNSSLSKREILLNENSLNLNNFTTAVPPPLNENYLCNNTFTADPPLIVNKKVQKYGNNCNITFTSTCTPPKTTTITTTTTTTLTAKDFNKNALKCYTTANATTSITITSTTTTNFPTKVAAIKNPKPLIISYTNSSSSSFSPLCYTNKTFTTAKYHLKKATTIAAPTTTTTKTTTTTLFTTPAASLKNATTKINVPKVLPRRLLVVNAPSKTTTTKTCIKTTATTTTTTSTPTTSCSIASSTTTTTTTSSSFKPFKISSYTTTTTTTTNITTCSSANKKVPPLRRRIPGNTLYYV